MSNWTLLSNHGHVLVCLSRDPEARLRDVSADVGITERAVQKIVRDLQDADMLSVTKNGRRNSYRVHSKAHLRHPLEADCTLKDLLKVTNRSKKAKTKPARVTQSDARQKLKPTADVIPDSAQQETKQSPKVPTREVAEPEAISPKAGKSRSKGKKTTSKDSKDSSEIATKIEKQQGTLF